MPQVSELKPYINQTWVIAVSGGPDSMALLDMAYVSGIHCLVVHVNYHKRETADRDEQYILDYCKQNNILVFVYDAKKSQGNFQDYARNFRYAKCAEVVKKHNAQGVMVAHHLLDDIETYLIQKQRHSQVTYYGLKSSTMIHGVIVERPLLKWMKEDLVAYCVKQTILYGNDESNQRDDYLRNRIRKEILKDDLSLTLPRLMAEKNQLNQELKLNKTMYQSRIEQLSIPFDEFNALSYPMLFLQLWIRSHVDLKQISEDHLIELYKQIETAHDFNQKLGSWRLIKQYGHISLLSAPQPYTYSLKKAGPLKTVDFEIVTSAQEKHAFSVEDSDFPLTIRNAQTGEVYLKDGLCHKLSRWFISHKIPQNERERWPIVLNCKKEVIHIYRIRLSRSLNTTKTCLYMIK